MKTIVGLKNNIHGIMLGYGIVTKPSQIQSKKGRQQLRNELEAHAEFNVEAASVLDCILKVLEDTSASLKEVEQALERYVEKIGALFEGIQRCDLTGSYYQERAQRVEDSHGSSCDGNIASAREKP